MDDRISRPNFYRIWIDDRLSRKKERSRVLHVIKSTNREGGKGERGIRSTSSKMRSINMVIL